jgi:3D (Asp-Asp-Asp) domain-containing protein
VALNRTRLVKALLAIAVLVGVFSAYMVSTRDSSPSAAGSTKPGTKPVPGTRLRFEATAYCKGATTASGVAVQDGSVAADPAILPLGSVVKVEVDEIDEFHGLYTVLDTGPEVRGREIDVYMWSCHEALRFGRRDVDLTVVRVGWDPRAIVPDRSLLERWFKRPTPAATDKPPTGSKSSEPRPKAKKP